jgi:N utilization substance protein A
MRTDPDTILALQGMGPKAMTEIEEALTGMTILQPLALPSIESIKPVEGVTEEIVEAAEAEPATEIALPETEGKSAEELKPIVEMGPEEELPQSLDEIFALKPEVLVSTPSDEEEEGGDDSKKPGKKKKKKSVEMEYDPDKGIMVAKKKHKRPGAWGDWEDW